METPMTRMAFIRAGSETLSAAKFARRAGNEPHADYLDLLAAWYSRGATRGYVNESYGLIETRHYLHNEFAPGPTNRLPVVSRVLMNAPSRDRLARPWSYEGDPDD